jgi:RNA polymerase sigma-70 factor (ECF subfamily)
MDDPKHTEGTLQPAAATANESGPDLARIYREHQGRVFRAAYRITGNAQDAEDVLQTVFLRLARREGGTFLSDSPIHYLHRAAVNAALDVVRSRRASRTTALDDVAPVLAGDPTEAPDRLRGGTEIRERIREELARVNAKAAEIFVLRYFEGYGNHEIAEMLGTSRSTVNVTLHRTRARLREAIAPFVGGSK